MAFHRELNTTVSREAAERLQLKLYTAAEKALDLALENGVIPGNLLSSCQSILRDASLTPDLTPEDEKNDSAGDSSQSIWLSNFESEYGLGG